MGIDTDRIVRQDLLEVFQECICVFCDDLVVPSSALQAPCGHIFCSQCIHQSITSSRPECPNDKTPVTSESLQAFKDVNPALYRMLGRVPVRCARYRERCMWQGSLSDAGEHEDRCSGITHCECCDESRQRCEELAEGAREAAARCEELRASAAAAVQQLSLQRAHGERLQERINEQQAEAALAAREIREQVAGAEAQLAAQRTRCADLERRAAERTAEEREAGLEREQLQQSLARAADELEEWKEREAELRSENGNLDRRAKGYRAVVSNLEEEVTGLKERLATALSRNREGGAWAHHDPPSTPPRRAVVLAPAGAGNGFAPGEPSIGGAPSIDLSKAPGPSNHSSPPMSPLPQQREFANGAGGSGQLSDGGSSVVSEGQSSVSRTASYVSNPTSDAWLGDLTGHTDWVTALALSDDNVFSASIDKSIKLWKGDACVATLEGAARSVYSKSRDRGHKDAVTALCYSPHDRVLYSASNDRTIKAWAGGTCNATLKDHKGAVLALAVSPKSVLFSGGDDATIRRWENGQRRAVYTGHAAAVTALAIAPDGLLWSGDADGYVKGWQNGHCFATTKAHMGRITGLAFDPEGVLWTASCVEMAVKGWRDGRCAVELKGHVDVVTALAVAPDGTVWSGSRDKTVRGYRVEGGGGVACVAVYMGHTGDVTALAAAPDGTLWSGACDRLVKRWRSPGQWGRPGLGAR